VENNHDLKLKLRFIEDLTTRPLAEIAAEPYVTSALAPVLAAHKRGIDIVRARARFERGVVAFDVADDGLEAANKFIPYFLFPDCHYVVGVSLTPTRAKVSVGSNPWQSARRTVNIAELCEKYGGGGHPVVGAISLPTAELPRARQVAAEIAETLRTAAPKEV
ncbi:MAG TPA: phosphoesterase, partial [Polyangia bacterium]